jgi:hypothetical protein
MIYFAPEARQRYAALGLDGPIGYFASRSAALGAVAAEPVSEHLEARPLFAAHAALPWPDEPHLVLWHAQTLLREFRGDGHLTALLVAGVDGLDALVLHAATGEVPGRFLQSSRGWSADEWAAAVDRLRSRGLLAAGGKSITTGQAAGGSNTDVLAFTDAGREFRQLIEDRTDVLAEPAYRVLGEDGCARLAELARPLSRAVVDAGLLDPRGTLTVR